MSKKQWYEVRMPEWFLKLQDLLLKQESGVKPAEIEMEYDDNMIAFMTRNNLRHIAKKENDETQVCVFTIFVSHNLTHNQVLPCILFCHVNCHF